MKTALQGCTAFNPQYTLTTLPPPSTHTYTHTGTYWHCHNAACGSNSGNGWQGAAADIFIAARLLFKLFRIAFEIVAVTVAAAPAPATVAAAARTAQLLLKNYVI